MIIDHTGNMDMLVLSRGVGERFMIGDEITVVVLGVKGSQIRLGINAPREIDVHREEIYHKVQAEKELKSGTG